MAMTAQQNFEIQRHFKDIGSEMELLLALGEHVSSELDLDRLLQLVAESAREVMSAQTLLVPVIDEAAGIYTYRSAVGSNAGMIIDQSFPLSVGMCGWVLSNRRALLFGHGNPLPMGDRTVWEEGMESALLVPLISRGRIIGGLSALGKEGGGSFTQHDLELLTLFANQTAVAVENAQILQQLKDKRQRLSEVLEDTQFEKQMAEVTLEAIADGVAVTDPTGRIVNLNHAAGELAGVTAQMAIGKPIAQMLPVDGWSDEPGGHPLERALLTDATVPMSGFLLTPDARRVPIEGSVSIMREPTGSAIGAVMLFRDVSAQHSMLAQIHHYATYDQLTGLINRREFEARLHQTIEHARQHGSTHALCYIDLDQFKLVNDTSGHAAGDELLRQLSALLSPSIRLRDVFGRIGGDEFGLILRDCSAPEAMRLAEQLREQMEAFRFSAGQQVFRIGASIGVVMITAGSPGINALFSAADQACYAAKESGRNRVKMYTETDEHLQIRSTEMYWVSRLHQALAEDSFELYFQPIVESSMSSLPSEFHRYEVLLRLPDQDGRLVPPGAFLPAAERFGLSSAIDIWVIRNYFKQLQLHPRHAAALQQVSINLSGASLGDQRVLNAVKGLLQQGVIPACKLCLEITETAAISNLGEARRFIAELSRLGVCFALDDFGTGMSSFSYLKQLPANTIKIDGSFIKDVLTDPIDSSLVSTMVSISRATGKRTAGEYVESLDILAHIHELGVDYAQGFGIARPAPLAELLERG